MGKELPVFDLLVFKDILEHLEDSAGGEEFLQLIQGALEEGVLSFHVDGHDVGEKLNLLEFLALHVTHFVDQHREVQLHEVGLGLERVPGQQLGEAVNHLKNLVICLELFQYGDEEGSVILQKGEFEDIENLDDINLWMFLLLCDPR